MLISITITIIVVKFSLPILYNVRTTKRLNIYAL